MIYVEVLGRMGNQMFSYAMAKRIQLSEPRQQITFDFTNFEEKDSTWINYIKKFKCGSEVARGGGG